MTAREIIQGMSIAMLESRMKHYRELLEREKGGGKLSLPHMVPAWTEGLSIMEDVYRQKVKKIQSTLFK